MSPALIVRFHPLGPWRIGPDSGARDGVEMVFHSDSLFSAVTHAMLRLGSLEDWLAATAGAEGEPAVRLSSLFPALGDTLFVPPPRSLWPPPASPKVRWRNARFVPLPVVRDLVADRLPKDNRWFVDGFSGCLLPGSDQSLSGPFRPALRSNAAVDRLRGDAVEVHRTACLEFASGGGFWGVVGFASEEARERWGGPLETAFRLLADTGLGGERSAGWGRSAQPDFQYGQLPDLIVPPREPVAEPVAAPAEDAEGAPLPPKPPVENGWWLLSLFSPAETEPIEWSRGAYSLIVRAGRVESPASSGALKKSLRMVEEGGVVASPEPPRGTAPNVAPDGFAHPVYRFGYALAIPVPLRGAA